MEQAFALLQELKRIRKKRFGFLRRYPAKIKSYSLKQDRLLPSINEPGSKERYIRLIQSKRDAYKIGALNQEIALLRKLYMMAGTALQDPEVKAQLGNNYNNAARHIAQGERWLTNFEERFSQLEQEFSALEITVNKTRWVTDPIIREHEKAKSLERSVSNYERWSGLVITGLDNALDEFRISGWYTMLSNPLAGMGKKAKAALGYALIIAILTPTVMALTPGTGYAEVKGKVSVSEQVKKSAGEQDLEIKINKTAQDWADLSEQYLDNGDTEKGGKAAEEALRLDPNNSDAHNEMGRYHMRNKDYVNAEKEIDTAIKIDHDNNEAHNNLGLVYYKQKRYQEAIDEYNTAIRINPNDVSAHYNRGLAYFKIGKYKESVSEFDKTLKLDPSHKKAKKSMDYVIKKFGDQLR